MSAPAPSNDRGFSLIEVILVLALIAGMCGVFFGSFQALSATFQGDSDMRVVEWQLKLARETAINQRRSIEVKFTNPNLITVTRDNLPNGQTVISTIYLEHNAKFMQFAGQPDTPDQFGNASAVYFGTATTIMFTADGMLVDQTGNPINGTIFIGQAGRPGTSRALSVFGPT